MGNIILILNIEVRLKDFDTKVEQLESIKLLLNGTRKHRNIFFCPFLFRTRYQLSNFPTYLLFQNSCVSFNFLTFKKPYSNFLKYIGGLENITEMKYELIAFHVCNKYQVTLKKKKFWGTSDLKYPEIKFHFCISKPSDSVLLRSLLKYFSHVNLCLTISYVY